MLVSTIVLVIFLTTLVVAITSARTASSIIDWLWDQLSEQLVDRTIERSLRYLDIAPPLAKQSMEIVTHPNQDDTHRNAAFFNYGADILSTYRQLASVIYLDKEGSYLSATRSPQGIVGTKCLKEPGDLSAGYITASRYLYQGDNIWSPEEDDVENCSLPQMPWWQEIFSLKSGAWTEPYVTPSLGTSAFTYIAPVMQGEVATGFWLFEFTTQTLSDFVSQIHLGKEGQGRVFIVTKRGNIVAHPTNAKVRMENAKGLLVPAASIPKDAKQAWRLIQKEENKTMHFEVNGFVCVSKMFPSSSGINWFVIAAVPTEELFGAIHNMIKWHILGACLIAIVMISVSASFVGKISTSLRHVARELHILRNFTISKDVFSKTNALIREVNVMNEAVDGLKSGLSSFGKYVPRALVSELLKSGQEAQLGGTRKELTILFSDLVNFTHLAETLPTDRLVHLLACYFEAMEKVIADTQGVVDKFIGDSIMAFWGAPHALQQHALMATHAAWDMKKCLANLNTEWKKEGLPTLQQRIGVNTGIVIIGNVGSPERFNYTVMGDPVNLASRIEDLSRRYQTEILLGESTARHADAEFALRLVDWVCVKGRTQPVKVYEPIALLCEQTEKQRSAIQAYESALTFYQTRQFAQAKDGFLESLSLFGGCDGPSSAMLEKCDEFIEHPPSPDWKGCH